MRRTFVVSSLALMSASLVAPAAAQRLHQYLVTLDEDLSALQVRACFAGQMPLRLVAESLDASLALETAKREGNPKRLEPNGTELLLGSASGTGTCIDYRVNLAEAGRHQHGGNPTRRVGSDLITDIGLWLWRPETLVDDEDIEVRFVLPPGIAVSAPWQQVDAAIGGKTYRVGHSAYEWPGTVAFGHFTEQVVAVPGGRMLVSILDSRPRADEREIISWLEDAARAVSNLYGRFPVPSLQVVVVPGARSVGPVPSAYVLRGGGPGAHFFINQRRPFDELRSDWSAVHELSHLLLPYIVSEDSWLSEGLASYYQHVLRARAGMISAQKAWQALDESFEQARHDVPGTTLAAATERMYRNGEFMRVYWEGAALMLLADQRLRSRSDGKQSLDTVLEQLQRCCLSSEAEWHARELLHRLDQLAGGSVFRELYEHEVQAESFPDLVESYRLLGLQRSAGRLHFTDDAPQRNDRDAIMAPASFASEAHQN